MLLKSRFVFAGFAVIVAALLLSYAASAASTEGSLTAGTTRYAVVSATNNIYTNFNTFVGLPGLSTTITIPSGKKGDVMVSFCGEVWSDGYLVVRALIGGVVAAPPQMELFNGGNDFESRCANFYRLNVPSGNVPVKMQWMGLYSYAGTQWIIDRTMMVTANIH